MDTNLQVAPEYSLNRSVQAALSSPGLLVRALEMPGPWRYS